MITAVLIVVVLLLLALFVLFNKKIVNIIMKNADAMESGVSRTLGKKLKNFDKRLEKESAISNKGMYRKLNLYFDDILVQMDLKREGVSVTTFIFFLAIVASAIAFVISFLMGDLFMGTVGFFAVFYLLMTAFRFMALMRYETKESILMETMDLIAMDSAEGVKNAITRYCGSFHPSVRPYFEQFLDDINYQGYSFKEAMHKLNKNLGVGFNEFARACIQYEYQADDTLIDVFSPIVDSNREKRNQRAISNKRFAELRSIFLASCAVVFGYGGILMLVDLQAREILIGNGIGRASFVLDILIVTVVLAYITKIKAKFLR